VKECLFEYAKKNPGKLDERLLRATGTTGHLGGELVTRR